MDVIYGSFRRLEQLIQTISIPYKGLSEHEKEIIRIAHRDYLNNLKITQHAYLCTWGLDVIKGDFTRSKVGVYDG